MGAMMGYCSGVVFRKVSEQAAFYVGCGFIFIQVLSKSGFISVNWDKVQDAVPLDQLDQNGDGKLDDKDVKIAVKRVVDYLGDGVPGAAGFGVAFAFGAGLVPFLS